MGWKWGTKSKWYNGNSRKHTRYDLNYDWQGNTRTNHWASTWTTGSTRWAKRTTNRQQRTANKLCIAYELGMHEEDQLIEDWWPDDIDEMYEDWLNEIAEGHDWDYDDIPDVYEDSMYDDPYYYEDIYSSHLDYD